MKVFINGILLNLYKRYIYKNGAAEGGIFISQLCYMYLQIVDVSKRDFFKSLRNSIDIIEKEMNEAYGDKE